MKKIELRNIIKERKTKEDKLKLIFLTQHEIINKILKYDKNLKPILYNNAIKKQIKTLLIFERKFINEIL